MPKFKIALLIYQITYSPLLTSGVFIKIAHKYFLPDFLYRRIQAGVYAYTNDTGTFEFYLNTGQELIQPELGQCWEMTTGADQYQITTTVDSTQNILFGVSSISDEAALSPCLHSGPTHCGFTVPCWLKLRNTGYIALKGKVGLVLDPLVEVVDTNILATSTSRDTIWWEDLSLRENEDYQVQLLLKMPNEDFDGDLISIDVVSFFHDSNTEEVVGGSYAYRQPITCAIDPNDKLVSPARENIAPRNNTTFEEPLQYTIRFQNTGSDTPFNIRIEDHLSVHLDWDSFQPGVSSHRYEVNLDKDGLRSFYFPNIYLPDSSTNEIASHGFVNFSIHAREGLPEFEEVNNAAGIFFDFNRPIITNTTNNVMLIALDADEDGIPLWIDCDGLDLIVGISEVTEQQIKIYPNPTDSNLFIDLEGSQSLQASVHAMNGQLLRELTINPGRSTIDLKGIPSGLLLLRVAPMSIE